MLSLKIDVSLSGLTPQTVLMASVVDQVYVKNGADTTVITSCNDSAHSQTSLHYSGNALDFRVRDPMTGKSVFAENVTAQHVANEIKAALGRDFDVLNEGDHLHVEYQPRRPA